MTDGCSFEGRVGGAKCNTPCTTTSPPAIFILNTMSCLVIIMYAIVIEPNIIIITAEVLYSMRTRVVNVSQLLALHVFHIRTAARIPLGHDGSLWPVCLLRMFHYVLFAFCRTSSMACVLHDAHWSKLRIVLFFDIAGLT